MKQPKEQLYQIAPLDGYTLKQRIAIRLADVLFFVCIKIIGSTIRWEVRGADNFKAVESAGRVPILAFWHDRIFSGTYFWRNKGFVVMTSKSFDGEYIARFIRRFGYGAIRGSSSRGGAVALIEMIRAMRDGHPMAFALDGPRGPRYHAKSGAVVLAKKTGNPLLPFIVQPRRYWQLKSWDRMQIPFPFTRALVIIGEPIYVEAVLGGDTVKEKTAELQTALDTLNEQALAG